MLTRIVLIEFANWSNSWYRFPKLDTVCKYSSVPLFYSNVSNYVAAAAIWSVLCIAFCCCLYHIHTALCSCAAIGNVHPIGLCESHVQVVCWSLLLQISSSYHHLRHNHSVSRLRPFDPFLPPLNIYNASPCFVFSHGAIDGEIRDIFLNPLIFFSSFTIFISKFIHTWNLFNCCQRNLISDGFGLCF
jgi:hypothetical protein